MLDSLSCSLRPCDVGPCPSPASPGTHRPTKRREARLLAAKRPKSPGKPNAVRLYSIASTRYGDDLDGDSVSLCVRRATYWGPELKADDPAKKGVCSNFLCDSKPGQDLSLTGPSGKVMLIPETDPNVDLIMVATGTGIAPYRSMIRRLFVEKTPCASL